MSRKREPRTFIPTPQDEELQIWENVRKSLQDLQALRRKSESNVNKANKLLSEIIDPPATESEKDPSQFLVSVLKPQLERVGGVVRVEAEEEIRIIDLALEQLSLLIAVRSGPDQSNIAPPPRNKRRKLAPPEANSGTNTARNSSSPPSANRITSSPSPVPLLTPNGGAGDGVATPSSSASASGSVPPHSDPVAPPLIPPSVTTSIGGTGNNKGKGKPVLKPLNGTDPNTRPKAQRITVTRSTNSPGRSNAVSPGALTVKTEDLPNSVPVSGLSRSTRSKRQTGATVKESSPEPSPTSAEATAVPDDDSSPRRHLPAPAPATSTAKILSANLKSRKLALADQLPLAEGRFVAFRPPLNKGGHVSKFHGAQGAGKGMVKEGREDWILVEVKKCINGDKNRYEVQDIQDAEGAPGKRGNCFNTTLKAIVPLPDSRNQMGYPPRDWPIGTEVMALYPDTTSFYKGMVSAIPEEDSTPRVYQVAFDEDEGPAKPVQEDMLTEWPR